MTPDRLREIGEALYGPRWIAPLARDLERTDKTVQRWLAGTTPIPETIASQIKALARSRIALLRSVA